jgi:hypothetical protein
VRVDTAGASEGQNGYRLRFGSAFSRKRELLPRKGRCRGRGARWKRARNGGVCYVLERHRRMPEWMDKDADIGKTWMRTASLSRQCALLVSGPKGSCRVCMLPNWAVHVHAARLR